MSVDSEQTYQLPPRAIVDLVDAEPTPYLALDPTRSVMALMHRPSMPSIADVAREEARLAGLRIDPKTNGPSRVDYFTGYTLRDLKTRVDTVVAGLPDGAGLGQTHFSPDGSRIAFTMREEDGLSLWVVETADGQARRLTEPVLNGVFGAAFQWRSDSQVLIARLLPESRTRPETNSNTPVGPVIQDNDGRTAPSRTYQDLLRNDSDAAWFDYYATSQLALVTVDGSVARVGDPKILTRSAPSPDGAYILVESLKRPYSYLVPYYRFPETVEVLTAGGAFVRTLADLPLAEEVPIAFDAVAVGARSHEWRGDTDAEVVWVEAQDGGDPSIEAEVRDIAYSLRAPFDGDGQELMRFSLRQMDFNWGRGDLALGRERWWKDRRVRVWRFRPDESGQDPELVFDRSYEDRYSDPGSPLHHSSDFGTRILWSDQDTLYLSGDGASPEGDRPFLDRYDLGSGESERLLHCEPSVYERPIQILDESGPVVLVSRETEDEPTNYYLRDLRDLRDPGGDALIAVTDFPHPYPSISKANKELIRYPREDGVQLTATLHTPSGYTTDDGPLPTILWAYPREFKNADAAGQVKDSPNRFARMAPHSPLYLLTQGYAVLDGPTMPIVGEGDEEANDTYVEQLVASAKGAIDEVVGRGVTDRDRVAVGGHSYGAFMTANLLAHTDFFKAGIARSGAYNRTLTPFGFQSEERTIWQAPEVYSSMSPFMHVDRIKAPLLLMHGEADNNSGTFPMQSERFYNALKGHGVVTRLVMLPHESHGYRARESILHMLYEMTRWLDRYVKNPA
jgi:dipeptidyl aminopeptidase/acylaminoacyl peptidase